MNKTKIEWVVNPDGTQGFTWNVVTGCLHGCDYCYARGIAARFGDTFPKGFKPDFHPHRLSEPMRRKKAATIFVCSMADLFGKWVPAEWIEAVLETVRTCPQHTFLFLTKNPERYREFSFTENCLIGATATNVRQWDAAFMASEDEFSPMVDFISAEPLLEPIDPFGIEYLRWLIIGANSNRGAEKPERKWGNDLVTAAEDVGVPVFVKNNWPYHESYGYRESPPRFNWPQELPERLRGGVDG